MKRIYDIGIHGRKIKHGDFEGLCKECMLMCEGEDGYIVGVFENENQEHLTCIYDCSNNRVMPIEQNQLVKFINEQIRHNKRLKNGKPLETEQMVLPKDIHDDSLWIYNGNRYALSETSSAPMHITQSMLAIGDIHVEGIKYSIWQTQMGVSIIVSIPKEIFEEKMLGIGLYNEVHLKWQCSQQEYEEIGNIVQIRKEDSTYVCFVQPYACEILQSTIIYNTRFNDIINPFTMADFLVNTSDSDIKGINVENQKKTLNKYLIVSAVKNLQIEIEDFSLGEVRINENVEISKEYLSLLEEKYKEPYSLIWITVHGYSHYEALELAREKMQLVLNIMEFIMKNDTYADSYGIYVNETKNWDLRRHIPNVELSDCFYIENCALRENIIVAGNALQEPSFSKIENDQRERFEREWIEHLYLANEKEDVKVQRLLYAISWIGKAWKTSNKFDKLIYCIMGLEFILNGEKGQGIIGEYIIKNNKTNGNEISKKALVSSIVQNIRIDSYEGMDDEILEELNESVENIIRQSLGNQSFASKLQELVNRLHIPIMQDEMKLIEKARKARNSLIHGTTMESLSTYEIKEVCGAISKILMYKIAERLQIDNEYN